jgi:hypothetical protein
MRAIRSVVSILFIGIFLMNQAPCIRAADVTAQWFGGYGFWTEGTNWMHTPVVSNASYPSNGALTYDVEILAGNVFVPAPVTLTVDKLTLGGGSLYHDSTLTAKDKVVWTNGNFSGNGTFLASNGIFVAGEDFKISSTTIQTYGDSLSAKSNRVAIWEWDNFGTFDIQDGSELFGIYKNEGVIRKRDSTGVASIESLYQSKGRLEIENGSVALKGGAVGGQINIQSNCALILPDHHITFAGTEIIGKGRIQIAPHFSFEAISNNSCALDLHMIESTFYLSGSWQLRSNATLTLYRTALQGSGILGIPPGATVEILEGGFASLGWAYVTNTGTIRFVGPGSSYGTGRTLNYSYFELTNGITIDNGYGTTSYLHNYGEIRKAGPEICELKGEGIENHGLLRVDAGTLRFERSGTNDGAFNIAPGANLSVRSCTFAEGARFIGGGTNSIVDRVQVIGAITNQTRMRLYDYFPPGAIWGPGTLHVSPPGVLDWGGGSLGCNVEIHPGAILLGGSRDFYAGFSQKIRNRGTAYLNGSIHWEQSDFQNDGVVVVTNGCLLYDSLFPSPKTFLNFGELLITNGVFQLPQTITNRGAIHCTNATFRVPHFCNHGDANISGTLDSSWVENHGTLRIKGTLLGSLTNFGTLEINESFETAEITNAVHLSTDSMINLNIGGTTPGTQFDQLRVRETVSLGGTLNVRLTNDFMPTLGQRFTLITWKDSHGFFSRIRGLNIGQGLRLVPVMTSDRLELVVMTAPTSSTLPLQVRQQASNQLQVTWPAPFQGFYLETTTNLTSAIWENLGLTDAEPAWFNFNTPQRFIRLRDPECCE